MTQKNRSRQVFRSTLSRFAQRLLWLLLLCLPSTHDLRGGACGSPAGSPGRAKEKEPGVFYTRSAHSACPGDPSYVIPASSYTVTVPGIGGAYDGVVWNIPGDQFEVRQ